MTDEELLGLQHTVEKADEDLTALTGEVEKLKRENAELRALHEKEIAELRALIHELAGVTKHAEGFFAMQIASNDTIQKHRSTFSNGLAEIYTKTSPR